MTVYHEVHEMEECEHCSNIDSVAKQSEIVSDLQSKISDLNWTQVEDTDPLTDLMNKIDEYLDEFEDMFMKKIEELMTGKNLYTIQEELKKTAKVSHAIANEIYEYELELDKLSQFSCSDIEENINEYNSLVDKLYDIGSDECSECDGHKCVSDNADRFGVSNLEPKTDCGELANFKSHF